MSDTSTHEEVDEEAPEGGISQLRESARKGQHAVAENTDLKRQILFMKAGIDLDTKLGKMLYRTFEGNDLDALKAEATELGMLGNSPSQADLDAEAERSAEDTRRSSAQQSLSGGRAGAPTIEEGLDPRHAALESFQIDLRQGVDRDEAQQNAISKVLSAAANGDRRVAWNHEAHLAAGREADRIASGRSS